MSYTTNIQPQENSHEIERFIVFRFSTRLRKGIKNRIKSLGCSWNTLFQGWICPLFKEKEVRCAIDDAKVEYTTQTLSLPKGSLPTDPKIASREARVDILERNYYDADTELLQDVYSFLRDAKRIDNKGSLDSFNPDKHKVNLVIVAQNVAPISPSKEGHLDKNVN